MPDAPARRDAVFLPVLFSILPRYTRSDLARDASAGVIVGLVALPLAIAFAIASGVSPERGLATAIVAGLVVALLGGSKVQIAGPTGAFVVVVYKIVETHGVDGLLLCTVMAGALLIAMGLLRMGGAIRYIPYPLTVGFTTGIAVVIFSSQIKDLLGLRTGPLPAGFLDKWRLYGATLGTADAATCALSAACLILLWLWPKVSRRFPGPIVVVLAATAAARLLHLPVETIASRFGALPAVLPHPTFPSWSPEKLQTLARPAFTVAMLGAIESLLSATVADSMIEARHRANTELIAQGLANVLCPLFGGIPATGAIARTATNVKNGGRSPIAAAVHAATLLLIVALFGRWAGSIPLCALAAILVVVSYHMSEWHAFRALLSAPRSDVAVLLLTFLLTVVVDLTVAVEVGMLAALLLFVRRMTDVTKVEPASSFPPEAIPEGVAVYEAEGAFFFGVAESLRDTFQLGTFPPKLLVLSLRHVVALDASGLQALRDLGRSCSRAGTRLTLSDLREQPLRALRRSGVLKDLGGESAVFPTVSAALDKARAS